MKKLALLFSTLLIASMAFAGGSIFGGHKTRSSNPNGVSSIGIHICDSLNCPGVILKKDDCKTIEHAITEYGVCVCEDGYVVQDGLCVPKGDKCEEDPIEHCTQCVTVDEQAVCTKCEKGYELKDGACPEQGPDGPSVDEAGIVCLDSEKTVVGPGETACSVCLSSVSRIVDEQEITGAWYDSDALCDSGKSCVSGKCVKPTIDYGAGGCLRNSDCESETAYGTGEECAGGKCFCAFNLNGVAGNVDRLECSTPKVGAGFCFLKETYSISLDEDEDGITATKSTKGMDWFGAKNFCEAHKKHMVSLPDSYCSETAGAWACEWTNWKGKMSGSVLWWSGNPNPSNACQGMAVAKLAKKVTGYNRSGNFYSAICK